MVAFPEAFTFNCYLQGLSFHHFFIRMYEILDSTTIPALTSWVVPSDISVEETQGNLDELKEYVSNLPVVHDAELWFGPSLHFFGSAKRFLFILFHVFVFTFSSHAFAIDCT